MEKNYCETPVIISGLYNFLIYLNYKPKPKLIKIYTDEEPCVICYQNNKEVTLYPCGHKCLCKSCIINIAIFEAKMECPLCRKSIESHA